MQPWREGMRLAALFCAQNAMIEAPSLLLFSVLGQEKHRSNRSVCTVRQENTVIIFAVAVLSITVEKRIACN